MSRNESIVENAALAWFGEQGGGRVKGEIGRVKSWSSFPVSLFAIHSCPALEWFGELGYAVGHGPHLASGEQAGGTLTPALSQGERESYGEVVLVGRLREAIRLLNPAIPEGPGQLFGNTEEFKFQPEGRRCHEEQTGA